MVSVICVGVPASQFEKSLLKSKIDFELKISFFSGNYNKSLNRGARNTKGEYIAFCNNDILFTPDWFEKILPHFDKYDSLSPHCPNSRWWKEQPTGVIEGYEIGRVLCGWCIVMPRSTYEKMGGFDEGVEFWYSDNIYADQLKYHGLKHALVTDSVVYHEGSRTLKSLPRPDQVRLTFSQETWYRKSRQKYLQTPA